MKRYLLLLLLIGCSKSPVDRLTGTPSTVPSAQPAQLVTVACCRDNTAGVLTYPPFLPQSQVDLCELIKYPHEVIKDGKVYLRMSVDCGHGHCDVGDAYYPSTGY